MTEQLELFVEREAQDSRERETHQKYKIPGRTESPTVSSAMLKCWVREFCEWNDIKIPKGLNKKGYEQLLGLYRGMLTFYDIKEFGQIIQRQYY